MNNHPKPGDLFRATLHLRWSPIGREEAGRLGNKPYPTRVVNAFENNIVMLLSWNNRPVPNDIIEDCYEASFMVGEEVAWAEFHTVERFFFLLEPVNLE